MNNLLNAIIFLIFFLVFNIKLKKGLSDPLVLHIIIWLFIFIIGYLNYDDFDELNEFFWNSWIFWFGSFALGYYIFNPNKNNCKKNEVSYHPLPDYSLFINLLTGLFFILTLIQGLSGGYGNFLMNLRLSFIEKTNTILLPFFFLFTFIWPLFLYEGVVYKNKKNLVALVFYLLVYSLASGGKFGILMTFSSLFLIMNHKKKINKKYFVLIFGVALMLVILLSMFREHGEGAFVGYSYAPVVAFQSIENYSNQIWGHETFRFFYSMLNTLKIINTQPPEDFYEYVFTPLPVNVYSAMRPFYCDFGSTGIIFGGLVYGSFFGYCYKGYLKGKLVQSALYFGYAFSIISIPFADLLFLNLSLVFRTLIIVPIIFIAVNTNNRMLKL